MSDTPKTPGWKVATHLDCEPKRVSFTVGVQSFLLAYDADTDEMAERMAEQLRHALRAVYNLGVEHGKAD